jgi:hypothetical protein
MTIPVPRSAKAPVGGSAAWIRAIAAGLSITGLATALRESSAGLDVTAIARRPGHRDISAILDEDGYAELRWWIDPAAPSAEVTVGLARALAAVPAPPIVVPPGTPQHAPCDPDELALIEAGFPAFRFWRETTWNGVRYVARGVDLSIHPHTVVAADLTELAAQLTVTQQPDR